MEGKWFVLFSHPGDFTPVCTTEFVSFAKKNEQFKELNAELIGLSVDQVFSHIKWVEWINENTDTQEVGRNVNEILRSLNALQVTDKYSVAAPENYPNNEWIGSDVIIPPAATEELKVHRLEDAKSGKIVCKDWWLCHKSL